MVKGKITLDYLRNKKNTGHKITMMTAYDYSSARLVDEAGIDVVLVGDSLGMVVLGYDSTVPVTMDEMVHHLKAVSRGVKNSFIIGDMPFMSYHVSREKAVENAGRFIKEGRCDAVKIEGGSKMAPIVQAVVDVGIPVCGHIGLTPQTATMLSGFKVQGQDKDSASELLTFARDIEDAGAFMIVMECIPDLLAKRIAEEVSIPAIGIGAGADCDGQVLVYHDVLGLFERFTPKFVKRYADLAPVIKEALIRYRNDVETGSFPGPEHCFHMKSDDVDKI
ncbi:MAG: 3-methyl-2-oxobutanoate hydroxymethyltransferase [Deltaproteobacteria bacterium]|nr:3-methyl-2-oxobutanoate hydroxymethyltransferase [Deltaproteobacteria bacterium]